MILAEFSGKELHKVCLLRTRGCSYCAYPSAWEAAGVLPLLQVVMLAMRLQSRPGGL
jgi:hypothetical protein